MNEGLSKRGLRSPAELAETRPHGDRLKYLAGCRCLQCRAANSNYETSRAAARKAGDWNGLVSAKRARRHILKLSRAGVGRRSLAEASDVGETCIVEIRSGKKKRIRKRTESRILAVTAAAFAGGALVPAKRTWLLINRLLENGFTRAEIARRLGYRRPALQFGKDLVTAQTAATVERFYRRVME
jgi:hypothetical protein